MAKDKIDKVTGEMRLGSEEQVFAAAVAGLVAPFLRTPYNYDTNAASDETALHCLDPSRTQQSGAEEADINVIVGRFLKTGVLPGSFGPAVFGDESKYPLDLRDALHTVMSARDQFYSLPFEVREKFDNDPITFADACSREDASDMLHDLGLMSDQAVLRRTQERKAAADAAFSERVAREGFKAPEGPSKGGNTP